MKKFALFLLLCIVVFATGCPKSTPVRPEVVTRIANYQIVQLDIDTANYECAVDGQTFDKTNLSYKTCGTNAQNLDKARQIRDEVIYRLIRITDYNYFQFENDLYVKRASGSVLADIIDTGANLAATISNGERTKTIINASLIAFRGSRKSASMHYFQEQTADVLITKMQTTRNRVLAEMLSQIHDKNVKEYPLDAALGDVIKYFYAGTLPRALQELTKDANLNAQQAENEVRRVTGLSERGLLTQEIRDNSVVATKTLNDLSTALDNAEDKAAALERLRNIVRELENDKKLEEYLTGKAVTHSTADGKQIIQTLKGMRRDKDDASDEEAVKEINTAIVKFGRLTKENK